MKKLLALASFCLVVFTIGSCERDVLVQDEPDSIYSAQLMNKNELLTDKDELCELGAKCEVPDCSGQTAWTYGPRYVKKGNWATYTPYTEGEEMQVDIIAGKNMLIGWAKIVSSIGDNDVEILIYLFHGWCLNDTPESIKIEAYNSVPPAINPHVGHFTYKYSLELNPDKYTTIDRHIPVAPYYGIHLDVGCCE